MTNLSLRTLVQDCCGEASRGRPFHAILFLLVMLALTSCILMKWLPGRRRDCLSPFPGPFTARFSHFSHCRRFLGGRQPYDMLKLHEKYGPAVRVAPNEISFNTAASWADIYDNRRRNKTFIKSEFYEGGNFAAESPSIVSVRDPEEHARMRKYLRDAFSDRSLREQEHLVRQNIDLFIRKIGEKGSGSTGVDIVVWFNLLTFDIIGSLAFGQSFGGLSTGTEHFWVSIVVKSLRMGAIADCFKRFPLIGAIFRRLFPKFLSRLIQDTRKHEAYTMELVRKRVSQKSHGKDFLAKMVENRQDHQISDLQIAAHSSDFVIAGSETTATALACITYYLQKDADVLQKLRREIRHRFQSYESINDASTTSLPYLRAVILDAMRLYPPLPFPLPRLVPEGGSTIDGHFVPGGTIVSTNPFAASMSPQNFTNPWEFRPDRWLGQNDHDVLEASQPFSLGTRTCMGKRLAWMELRTTLAKIHYRYDLELLDTSLDWHAASRMHTLWQKPVMRIRVRPRSGSE